MVAIGRSCGAAAVLLIVLSAAGALERPLPRFTEEREAAALHFVKKHCPELVPLLEDLQKNNRKQYEQEVREIFDVTEMLADLMDDARRHELELKIWKTENKAYVLVGKLSAPKEEDRKKAEAQLLELARELVELDVQSLEMQAEDLEHELGALKDDLARAKENVEKAVKDRHEGLLDHARKRKKRG